jgi:hypothetical protein
MALIRTDMNLVASGGYGKVWTYVTAADNIAAVKAAGYFNTMNAQLAVNDRIHVKASDGAFDAAVLTIAAGVVTIVSSATYA